MARKELSRLVCVACTMLTFVACAEEDTPRQVTDAAALHSAFQLRLVSVGSGTDFAHFYIDDFALGCL